MARRIRKPLTSAQKIARYEAFKRYRATDKGKAKKAEQMKRKRLRDKITVMGGYGGKCVCCGVIELVWLTIDHIANGGAEDRRRQGGRHTNSHAFYRRLIKEDFPEGFQVLCFNCNWAKSHGGCPHVL